MPGNYYLSGRAAHNQSQCGLHQGPRCNRRPATHAAPPERLDSTISERQGEEASPSGAFAAEQLLRPHLKTLAAYTPIEPFEVLSRKLGRRPEDIIKLDANENPYGAHPAVTRALGTMPFPHIYPDPECRTLRAALAEDLNVPAENIMVGCGADELIDLIMRCFLDPGDAIVDCPPTFTMYAFDAAVNAARVLTIPRVERAGAWGAFALDVPSIADAVRTHGPKIVFLTSPNNPDGSIIPEEDLLEILKLPVLVVLDEAYVEFTGGVGHAAWVCKWPNLIVLRTFSKSAGLAGLRIGYSAVPSALAPFLWRAKQPYNVSVAAETAALAALGERGYMVETLSVLIAERGRLEHALRSEVPYLEVCPSHSNFILCKVGGALTAKELKERLATEYGIMVRHYEKNLLDGYVRISVGRPEHTDALIAALKALMS